MKIVAVDIGNSRIRSALVQERQVLNQRRCATGDVKRALEGISRFLRQLADQPSRPVVVSSVVPAALDELEKGLGTLDVKPLVIGREIPLPLELAVRNPQAVGTDRVVGAAMAYHRIGQAVAVADFGTATTIDCVDDEAVFRGGAILAGLELCAESLAERTAALPKVKPADAGAVCGRDTEEAILSGLIYGAAGALREIVERFASELGKWPELIITGGWGPLIGRHCPFANAVVPDLTLMGIELAYEKWRQAAGKQ